MPQAIQSCSEISIADLLGVEVPKGDLVWWGWNVLDLLVDKMLGLFKAEGGPTGLKIFLSSEWKAVHEIYVKSDVKLLKDVCRELSKLENGNLKGG